MCVTDKYFSVAGHVTAAIHLCCLSFVVREAVMVVCGD